MKQNKSVSIKLLVLLMALTLMLGGVAGGTLAWLKTNTDPIVNTFTASDIKISLTESKNEFQLIPGHEYTKDPVVKVLKETNVNCWLFVKIEENNVNNVLEYSLNTEGWTRVATTDGSLVYSRTVTAIGEDQSWNLLKDNTVTISEDLELDGMAAASSATLTFTAYAIQTEGFATAELAWEEVGA